ncbi:MAG: hypothetical protein OSB09_05065 [Planctomycetota bacterium]|nr:hypothetical protein [Planctomycetota bacterium]
MSDSERLSRWWCSVEEAVSRGDGVVHDQDDWPAEISTLAEVAVAEVRFDLAGAQQLLDGLESLNSPWNHVARLLRLRLEFRSSRGVRASLKQLLEQSEQLVTELDRSEGTTCARTRHLMATVNLQLNRPGEALDQMVVALEELGDVPSRSWFLDSIAQAYLALGAWNEGRRTLRKSILAKDAVDDHLGIAISTGHLALAELQGGNPQSALKVLDETWSRRAASLEPLSRLRLVTFQLQAAVELEEPAEIKARWQRLDELLVECGEVAHYLVGFAFMARARARASIGDIDQIGADLDLAADRLQHPEMALLIDYWRVRLQPEERRASGWKQSMQKSIESLGSVSEGEILTRLLFAEEQMAQGDSKGAVEQLDQAFTRAIEANHPGWQEQVGRIFRQIDSEQYSRRTIERFSGRPAEEMEKTTTEDATIIFADLANFTSRSTELSAEEVMETVRSVFELAVPLLAKHHVRPLQHLGDGLLAACQGDDHSRRGLQFAIDLVERTNAASRIRRAQGESWGLDLRAGVNSGPVVFGLLGSSFKQEWLAIGMTTNLAARLQSKGEIGDVVTLPEIAERVGHVGPNDIVEHHPMKGFPDPVALLRIRV